MDREEDPSLINDENSNQFDEDLPIHEELILKYFASNQGVKQNFNQILQRMTNAEEDQEPQHPPLTQPPDDFVVKNFLETLTKDENVDTLSQSIKEARTIWNRKSGNIWTVNRKSSLVQGDSSFWGLSLRECKGSAHVGCKFHTSYKKAEWIVSNERIQKWHNDGV